MNEWMIAWLIETRKERMNALKKNKKKMNELKKEWMNELKKERIKEWANDEWIEEIKSK